MHYRVLSAASVLSKTGWIHSSQRGQSIHPPPMEAGTTSLPKIVWIRIEWVFVEWVAPQAAFLIKLRQQQSQQIVSAQIQNLVRSIIWDTPQIVRSAPNLELLGKAQKMCSDQEQLVMEYLRLWATIWIRPTIAMGNSISTIFQDSWPIDHKIQTASLTVLSRTRQLRSKACKNLLKIIWTQTLTQVICPSNHMWEVRREGILKAHYHRLHTHNTARSNTQRVTIFHTLIAGRTVCLETKSKRVAKRFRHHQTKNLLTLQIKIWIRLSRG